MRGESAGGRRSGSWPAHPAIYRNLLYKVTFFQTINHELKVLTKEQKRGILVLFGEETEVEMVVKRYALKKCAEMQKFYTLKP